MDAPSLDDGIRILSQHVCHEAMQAPHICHDFEHDSQTYAKVLKQIFAWLDEEVSQTEQILWVYGAAGSGKTSIAQSLTDSCRRSKQFGGSFFARREIKCLANGTPLIPTIAYQLATNFPELQRSINDIVCQEGILYSAPISDQFYSLIVRPIQESTPPVSTPLVIIIDGLDEYDVEGDGQRDILNCFADFLIRFNLPLRVIFTSRPELPICQALESGSLRNITRRIPLNDLPTNTAQSFLTDPISPSVEFTRIQSRRPQKRPVQFPSYPRIVTLLQRNGHAETYCRALLSAGNGFPMWMPSGNLAMPIDYLKKGINIGDVGIIDRDGSFQYFFNIFRAPDDPINNIVPREFHPIDPVLQPGESIYEDEHFKPGHVLASKGITIVRHSENPLDISFTSPEPEGGILILPCGASRQDLKSTTRFHEYARKNAPHWYQFINEYGGITEANGSLFFVTGCDKADDWAIASFPNHAGNTTDTFDLQYTWRPGYRNPWIHLGAVDTDFYAPNPDLPDVKKEKNQCIFVRGLRISLTQQSWQRTMPYVKQAKRHYSFILHEPSKFYLWLDSVLTFLRLRLSEKRAVSVVSIQKQHLFHPNFIISQMLLAEYPDAELALVDDSVWCSLIDNGFCTLSDMNELATRVFSLNKIIEHHGVISLQPKTSEELEQDLKTSKPSSRILPFSFFGSKSTCHMKDKSVQWVKSVPVYKHAKLF